MNEIMGKGRIGAVKQGIDQPISKENLKDALTKEKVYGEYPGNLPQSFVNKCKENDNSANFELSIYCGYKDAEETVNQIFISQRHDINIVSAEEKRDRIYAKHFLMTQTEKFGVKIERGDSGKIKRNDSFLERQKYRDNYFEQLDKDEKKAAEFLEALEKGEDITKYLPETDRNGIKRNERILNK